MAHRLTMLENKVNQLDLLLKNLMEWTHYKPPENLEEILIPIQKLTPSSPIRISPSPRPRTSITEGSRYATRSRNANDGKPLNKQNQPIPNDFQPSASVIKEEALSDLESDFELETTQSIGEADSSNFPDHEAFSSGEEEYIEGPSDDDSSFSDDFVLRPSTAKRKKTNLEPTSDSAETDTSKSKKCRATKGPYFCDECGHETRTKVELIEHERSHKIQPKCCDTCGESLEALLASSEAKLEGEDVRVLCHICGTPGAVEGKKKRKIREWVVDKIVESRAEAEKLILSSKEWKYKNSYESRDGRVIKYVCRESNSCASRWRILLPIRGGKPQIQRTSAEHDHTPKPSKNRGISKEAREKIADLIAEGYFRPRAILNELKSTGIQSYTLLQIRNYMQYCQKKHPKEPQKAEGEEEVETAAQIEEQLTNE